MLLVVIILFVLIIVIWLFGFFLFNDFRVRSRRSVDFRKVLLIYPHPDDEVFTAGAMIRKLANKGVEISVITLTRGEKGTPDASENTKLKDIRTKEIGNVSKILGINDLILKDFPDGGLDKVKQAVGKEIEKVINRVDPDLVITFDETGLYGHPDHIIVSEAVTNLLKRKHKRTDLWYASMPKKVLERIKLPEHMAKDRDYKRKRKYPNLKVYSGVDGLVCKIRGIYKYESQFGSFKKAFPFSWIPLWFYLSLQPYEYFHKVQ